MGGNYVSIQIECYERLVRDSERLNVIKNMLKINDSSIVYKETLENIIGIEREVKTNVTE